MILYEFCIRNEGLRIFCILEGFLPLPIHRVKV